MWLKIGLLTTLFTYLYWALQRMRRRRKRSGCSDCSDCSGCAGGCRPADEDNKQ